MQMDGDLIFRSEELLENEVSQESVDSINAVLFGDSEKKASPWDIERLEKHAEINRPRELDEVPGITVLFDGKPQIIKRTEILPVDHPKSWQVRGEGKTINITHQDELHGLISDLNRGWSYRSTLPVLEKLEKPIPRADGKGDYLYRIVEGRHRFGATFEYDDFPCYVVEGHAADIERLAGVLNNPDEQNKLVNTEEDVIRQVKQQIVWYDKTDGKKGLEPEVLVVMEYLRIWYNTLYSNDRRKFANTCLSSAGIVQDVKDYVIPTMDAFLKEYYPDKNLVAHGKKAQADSNGNYGYPLRHGRPEEQRNNIINVLRHQVSQFEDTGKVAPHYLITTQSIGKGVNVDPTIENMKDKRKEALHVYPNFVNFCYDVVAMVEAIPSTTPRLFHVPQLRTEDPTKLRNK